MKKIIFLLLISLAAGVSFAQNWKQAVVKGVVSQQVERHALEQSSFQLARISNWSKAPLFRIDQVPAVPGEILTATAINGDIFRQEVFPEPGLRKLPNELNDNYPALYRGMPLDLKDIKNLLENGMELERSSFPQLYFSADIDVALSCANEQNLLLPVVVKVKVTPELEMVRAPRLFEGDNYVFNGSIPAKHLDAAMVLLGVGKTRSWYKVVLENDELLFKPVTSNVFSKKDLIIHRIDASSSIVPDLRSLWENFGRDGLW